MRSVLAMAQLTLRAAWRGGSARLVAALLLAIAVGLPAVLRDDGTVAGRATLLVRLTLALSQGLLLVYLGWLAADLPARERASRQIALLQPRPASLTYRLLGRWLGLQALHAALLLVAGLALCANLAWRGQPVAASDAPSALQALAAQQRSSGQPDAARLAPGGQQTWRFPGAPTDDPPERLLRYRPRSVTGEPPLLDWYEGGRPLTGAAHSAGGVVTLRLPAAAATVLTVHNRSPHEVVWVGGDRPTLLLAAGGFGPNLARALWLCWLQGGLLAALGLLAGQLWEFATAACVVGGYLLLAVHVPWLPPSMSGEVARLAVAAVAGLVQSWPVPDLAAGWRVEWPAASGLLLGQTAALLLLTPWLAGRREAAAGERA